MPRAADFDMIIDQGQTVADVYTWKIAGAAQNLTGYSARLTVRKSWNSTAAYETMTNANGKLVLGGAAGTITVTLTDTVSTAYVPGRYVYDMEVESGGGDTTKLLRGTFTIRPEATY
jgi:hypothetical protein